MDGGFAGNDGLDFLETEQVESVVGLARNPRVERRAGRWARPLACRNTAAARSMSMGRPFMRPRPGRIVIKAEVVRWPGHEPHCHPRFVVTNLRDTPAAVFAVYCQRGDRANRLKEFPHGLALERTSGVRF